MDEPLVFFNPSIERLSRNERDVLVLLIEAAKLIAPLYRLQEGLYFPGDNFYPQDVTREEILEAAKTNRQILSPYTVVERVNGKLEPIPYHIKYRKFLDPIAQKLVEAAKITENSEFSQRLLLQAEALLQGTYDKSDIAWITLKPYVLDIVIGPIERYDDKLFFVKTSYQAWVGIMDDEETEKMRQYGKIIFSSRRQSMMPTEKVDFFDKIQVRMDDVAIFSGLISRTLFGGVNLPNDVQMMQQYGCEITIFRQTNEYRFKNEVLPTFERLFSNDFKKQFTLKELEYGTVYSLVLHEFAHSFLRYKNSEKNLQDLFPIIDELSAYVMGVRVCGALLVKDIMTTKELESIMVALLAKSFYLTSSDDVPRSREHYVKAHAILINYLFETGALRESGGVSWPNFMKMFFSIGELASILERILSSGRRADAEGFIKQYGEVQGLLRFK